MTSTPTKQVFNPLAGAGFNLVPQDAAQIVTVAASGAMFTTIQAAIDSITDATALKQYVIQVAPGTYAPFVAKAYCHIQGGAGTVLVAGTNATALTANLSGSDYVNISGLNFINYAGSDNSHTADLVGDVNFDLCNFYLVPTGDYSGVAVKTSAITLQIMGRCAVFIQPVGVTTKNIDGFRCNGSGTMSLYLTSAQILLNATSGDTCIIDENGTGERNYNNLLLIYRNSNASFSGMAKGFCVSSKSTGIRLSQESQIRLTGAGAGTAYAFAMDSSTNDANYFHTNSTVVVDGFATEGVSYTGAGDVQRVWLSSPTKNLSKYGTGLSVVTPLDKEESGFVQWGPEASYWTYNTGTAAFTVDKSGAGCVRGAPMSWAAGQSVTLTDRAVNYVYMTSAGVIGAATSGTGLYDANVVLFQIWRQGTNYIVCKENHPFKFTTAVSEAWHSLFGTLLQDATQTITVNSAANRTVNLVGSNTLTDHGLDTTISAQTPMTFSQMVEGVSGAMVRVANAQGIVSVKSNGTDTGVNVANNQYIVYRIGVVKESLNSATPTFITIADDTDSANLSGANTRITAGLVRPFPAEAKKLEIAQLGYAVVKADGAGGGSLDQVTTALQVFGAQFVSGGTSSAASLITTNTTNFNGELSGTETNVQLALDRLDDFDSLLDWGTGKAYRVGNVVRVTTEGFIGEWRCTTAHTASAAVTTDINLGYWEIVANSEGSRELINVASHGFVAGTPLARVGSAWVAANCTSEAYAEVQGIVAGVTTNYFVLVKTGKLTISGAAWPIEGGNANLVDNTTYWLAATSGKITATKPSTVTYIAKPLLNSFSTTAGNFFNGLGATVGGTNLYTTIPLNNGTATTILNLADDTTFPVGSSGELVGGGIKILQSGANPDYSFAFRLMWTKESSTVVNIQPDALAATPPGFAWGTSGAAITVSFTALGAFESGECRYTMNAAPLGAQLPLQIASNRITWSEPTMFRNRIKNGAMVIDQRNAGASVSANGDGVKAYPVDRFYIQRSLNINTLTAQQISSAPAGFSKALQITTNASTSSPGTTDYARLLYAVEGVDYFDLAWGTSSAKTVTLSFWVKSSVTGNYGVGFSNAASNRSYIASYTVNSANTWEYKTLVIPGDTTGTWATDTSAGVWLQWDLGVGTNISNTAGTWAGAYYYGLTGGVKLVQNSSATFAITGVQLEPGTVATPFEFRPYGTELDLCKRYFYRFSGKSLRINAAVGTGSGYFAFGQNLDMRTIPTRSTNIIDANFVSGTPSSNQWSVLTNGSAYGTKSGTASVYVENDYFLWVRFQNVTLTNYDTLQLGPSAYIDNNAEL